jgi:hypothetical protein
VRLFRRPFADVVERQLALFAADHARLVEAAVEARRAWRRAPAEEAEERYAELLDLVEEGREALTDLRDRYAASLPPEAEAAYRAAFARAVSRRWPTFAPDPELDDAPGDD